MANWQQRFFEMAMLVASWSKDPSTKVGAVIVRPDKTIASVGFNGFARGVMDDPNRYADRNEKYPRVVHAEMNAILNCHEKPVGYHLYQAPVAPCSACASCIIQSGITKVTVFDTAARVNNTAPNWRDTVGISVEMFAEAGVTFEVVAVSPYDVKELEDAALGLVKDYTWSTMNSSAYAESHPITRLVKVLRLRGRGNDIK